MDNNNNTTPAMKEVETLEQAADKYANYVKPNDKGEYYHHMAIDSAFIAGAQWREENPVMGEEIKTPEQILFEIGPTALQYQRGVIEAMKRYHAQFTLPPTPKQDKEWVRVEDGLPTAGVDVICKNEYNQKAVCFMSKENNFFFNALGCGYRFIATHWQPCP